MSYRIFSRVTVIFLAACASRGASVTDMPPAPATVIEEEATLAKATGNVVGTIKLPAARFPVPVAVIIAGSGPTDRNGNSPAIPGQNNSLRMIADALAEQGIASLRYDKRGIAGSRAAMTSEEELRFDHFVNDAADWIRQLRADKRFSTITVIGHSEGSLIGMVAARQASADGYVSIAGVGRPATEILMEQLSAQLPPPMLAQVADIMKKIEAGQKPDSVPPMLNALFRPSVQPYLTSWFAYDPATEIARLDVPVLIIQGTTDLQVKVEDANRLAAAKPGARLVIIEGMNHVLKAASGTLPEQMPSYGDPSLPVVPRLLSEVVTFVKSLPRR
jgi:pimeloyl-ACP methyl ester carboxylesterase